MIPEPVDIAARDDRLNEALLAYEEAVQAGRPLDRTRWLAEHADLADELREFLASRDHLDRLTGALRTVVPPPVAPPLGELGDFRLLREIGRGGMGVVYEAEQISLHRQVALKVLPFAAALDPRQLQRFRIEAQAAAQLHHTNIVPVFAVGCERGVHYYAMQFIEGQSLAALIDDLRQEARQARPASPLPSPSAATPARAALSTERSVRPRAFVAEVARLGKQAAEALEHAHQMGVVHRDIKPGNLLLDHYGRLWVADFGLAQFRNDTGLTATGEVLGTLRYASPEQARARPGVVDHRSDIYALGATLYELLTLRPVFDGKDRAELLRQIAQDEVIAPRSLDRTIPVELETILLKALAKNPAERYGSAREFADDLQRFLDDKPILARRPTLLERAARWSRRHRPVVVSALILLVAGVLGLAVSTLVVARAYESERLNAEEAHLKAEEARVKAEEARAAQARAEDNFRQAKRAVDLLTQISEDELAGMMFTESVRRRILDAALTYYQELLDQHRDDPAVRPELAACYARVSRLLAELSAIEGQGHLMLLTDPAVLRDLLTTEDQRHEIRELLAKMAAQWRTTSPELRQLSLEERQTKLAASARDNAKAMEAVLTPAQRERLKQIALQWRQRGPNGFRDPDIVAALKLSSKQQQKIRKIQEEMFQPQWRPAEAPQRYQDRLQQGRQKILEALTAEQLERWRQMSGEPCGFSR
jgi:serine/threonine protein kinase